MKRAMLLVLVMMGVVCGFAEVKADEYGYDCSELGSEVVCDDPTAPNFPWEYLQSEFWTNNPDLNPFRKYGPPKLLNKAEYLHACIMPEYCVNSTFYDIRTEPKDEDLGYINDSQGLEYFELGGVVYVIQSDKDELFITNTNDSIYYNNITGRSHWYGIPATHNFFGSDNNYEYYLLHLRNENCDQRHSCNPDDCEHSTSCNKNIYILSDLMFRTIPWPESYGHIGDIDVVKADDSVYLFIPLEGTGIPCIAVYKIFKNNGHLNVSFHLAIHPRSQDENKLAWVALHPLNPRLIFTAAGNSSQQALNVYTLPDFIENLNDPNDTLEVNAQSFPLTYPTTDSYFHIRYSTSGDISDSGILFLLINDCESWASPSECGFQLMQGLQMFNTFTGEMIGHFPAGVFGTLYDYQEFEGLSVFNFMGTHVHLEKYDTWSNGGQNEESSFYRMTFTDPKYFLDRDADWDGMYNADDPCPYVRPENDPDNDCIPTCNANVDALPENLTSLVFNQDIEELKGIVQSGNPRDINFYADDRHLCDTCPYANNYTLDTDFDCIPTCKGTKLYSKDAKKLLDLLNTLGRSPEALQSHDFYADEVFLCDPCDDIANLDFGQEEARDLDFDCIDDDTRDNCPPPDVFPSPVEIISYYHNPDQRNSDLATEIFMNPAHLPVFGDTRYDPTYFQGDTCEPDAMVWLKEQSGSSWQQSSYVSAFNMTKGGPYVTPEELETQVRVFSYSYAAPPKYVAEQGANNCAGGDNENATCQRYVQMRACACEEQENGGEEEEFCQNCDRADAHKYLTLTQNTTTFAAEGKEHTFRPLYKDRLQGRIERQRQPQSAQVTWYWHEDECEPNEDPRYCLDIEEGDYLVSRFSHALTIQELNAPNENTPAFHTDPFPYTYTMTVVNISNLPYSDKMHWADLSSGRVEFLFDDPPRRYVYDPQYETGIFLDDTSGVSDEHNKPGSAMAAGFSDILSNMDTRATLPLVQLFFGGTVSSTEASSDLYLSVSDNESSTWHDLSEVQAYVNHPYKTSGYDIAHIDDGMSGVETPEASYVPFARSNGYLFFDERNKKVILSGGQVPSTTPEETKGSTADILNYIKDELKRVEHAAENNNSACQNTSKATKGNVCYACGYVDILNLETMTWEPLPASPEFIPMGSPVYRYAANELWIFGAYLSKPVDPTMSAGVHYIFVLDISRQEWRIIPLPEGSPLINITSPSTYYDYHTDTFFVSGGVNIEDIESNLGGIWQYKPALDIWSEVVSLDEPMERLALMPLIYDFYDNKIVVLRRADETEPENRRAIAYYIDEGVWKDVAMAGDEVYVDGDEDMEAEVEIEVEVEEPEEPDPGCNDNGCSDNGCGRFNPIPVAGAAEPGWNDRDTNALFSFMFTLLLPALALILLWLRQRKRYGASDNNA